MFVNPTQFGPNEDFDRYPRTPDADASGLAVGRLRPAVVAFGAKRCIRYGPEATVQVRVPGVTEVLEGAHRPGHFDGVATVVARLFNQVQPDVAVFGRKDYQQLAGDPLPRERPGDSRSNSSARDTLREADGLAMSSRNQYLTAEQRPVAAEIHRTLAGDARRGRCRRRHRRRRESKRAPRWSGTDFAVDYVAVRRPDLTAAAGRGTSAGWWSWSRPGSAGPG